MPLRGRGPSSRRRAAIPPVMPGFGKAADGGASPARRAGGSDTTFDGSAPWLRTWLPSWAIPGCAEVELSRGRKPGGLTRYEVRRTRTFVAEKRRHASRWIPPSVRPCLPVRSLAEGANYPTDCGCQS
jgi:hypothetical protein